MNSELKPFYRTIGYVLMMHLIGLVALSLCRVVLLIGNMPESGVDWSLLPMAMLIGVKFDNLIACYVLALPVIVLPILSLCLLGKVQYKQWMTKATYVAEWYFGVLYSLMIFIGVANARYYHFFENHLNISVTEWFGFVGDTAGLVFGDSVNLIFLGIAVVMIVGYVLTIRYIHSIYLNRLEA